MQIVPVQTGVPNQVFNIQLAGQPVTIRLYEKSPGLFMDVLVNDALIIGGVICRQSVKIVRSLYLGFIGDLVFFDTTPSPIDGPQDPQFEDIGTRWPLYYLTSAEANDP